MIDQFLPTRVTWKTKYRALEMNLWVWTETTLDIGFLAELQVSI